MAEEERFECPECGSVFGSEETLKEHNRLEHGSMSIAESIPRDRVELKKIWQKLRPESLKSFGAGLLSGLLIAGVLVGGVTYWNLLDHRAKVPITVVTCDNCSYDKFRNATDRMFRAQYREVSYSSEEGQRLIDKYRINYVPAFIFDRKVEEAEAFDRVKSVLVKFEDAYVIPDKGARVAQRLSDGRSIKRQG